jgi:hypothetical protein
MDRAGHPGFYKGGGENGMDPLGWQAESQFWFSNTYFFSTVGILH